jgi:hypothetical protein
MRAAGLALLAAFIMWGAAGPVCAASSYMVGTWFGRGQPDNTLSMYIDRMDADGHWRGEYRTCQKGRAIDQVQAGRWELDGDRLLLHIQSVDGHPMSRTDTYQVLAHDARSQRYVFLPSGFVYTPHRVGDAFTMPPCNLVS